MCLPPILYGTAGCGVHTARHTRARRVRVCATAEGQVLQVAPHTAIFGAVESPAARIGTSNRSDAEIPHAKQNMEAATLHSAFLWESAQGNDADGWF